MKKSFKKLLSSVVATALLLGTLFAPVNRADAAGETLLNTYGAAFGYSGTCINLSQLKNANDLAFLKQHYNSVTLENEMKPDAMLGWSPSLISREEAKNQGYYIPSGMTETYVPKINFATVDEALRICKANGLKMRAHTLVWHSQTPDWFFRTGYSTNYGYVSQAQMDLRMEYYIKSVMNHVYTGQYADVVYCWDVVNEYQHAQNSGWLKIYGDVTNYPSFVKKAFQYAHDTLKYFGKENSVSLFYNDFNTYIEQDDIVTMINYINSNGKICDGVGMQSHLGTTYPSVDYYIGAMKKFLNAGFEVQITEIDVTNKGDVDMANYVYNLLSQVCALKKGGAKITGITWWGLSDQVTWIANASPLLFSSTGNAKYAYTRAIEAYTKSGLSGGSSNSGNNGSSNSGSVSTSENTIQCESMTKSGTYTGNISSPFNGVVLYANNDAVSFNKYFAYDTHDFTLRGASNCGTMARVDLVINNETKGTFYFGDEYPAEYTIKGVKHPTGDINIKLVVTADDGSWDVYMDYLAVGSASNSGSNNTTQQVAFDSTTKYKLTNRNSGKVLDVQYGSKDNGANVLQYTDEGNANQKWYLIPTGDGYYTIKNAYTEKLVDVSGKSKENGGDVIQYQSNGGTNQQWKIEATDNGYYRLINRNSGLALDVSGKSTADNGDVIQWAYNGGTNQQWKIEAVN
ncbi:MAG: endo-1,4-beta-xylanase [Lachnospiraceae bacterium]|nr:endo-1,4-beta-xylanase [Lachnospiraceae bacterium]